MSQVFSPSHQLQRFIVALLIALDYSDIYRFCNVSENTHFPYRVQQIQWFLLQPPQFTDNQLTKIWFHVFKQIRLALTGTKPFIFGMYISNADSKFYCNERKTNRLVNSLRSYFLYKHAFWYKHWCKNKLLCK